MISYEHMDDGGAYVVQSVKETTLYLDVWFWSRLAKSGEIRSRFLETAAPGCTIMYSITTMMELATIRNSEQVTAIREVMEAIDFGFINNDPNAVIALENQYETEIGSGVFSQCHPASDRDILNHLLKSKYPSTDLRMSDIYDELLGELPGLYQTMAAQLASTMNQLVRRARKSEHYMGKVKSRRKKRLTDRPAPPYTRDVLQRFLDYVITADNLRMTKNDWMDMMHLIVPLSYLSIVLADGRWLHFARSELRITNPNLAILYGPREVEEFLNAL